MDPPDRDLLAAAGGLARAAGRSAPTSLTALAGGNNNRVYRADIVGGVPLVLKSYFADPRDPRDRLGAEWAFISHAWQRGLRCLPEPLAMDRERHLGLYSLLPGSKLPAGGVERQHVEAAMDFILAINAAPRTPFALPAASEACFTLPEHLATVERRVERLARVDEAAPHRDAAERLVARSLVPAWRSVRERIDAAAAREPSLGMALEAGDQILSPSDFGFHNALARDDEVAFLDFEYAGRDDPAKLVCDFFCQPEVPVPIGFFAMAVDRLWSGLCLSAASRERVALLLDLYRVKWSCIILNPFLPVGAARRSFASAERFAERCATQLARAEAKLAEIGT